MAKPNRKILIFSLAYQPFIGGAEVAIKELTDRLGDDFNFDLITANLDGRQPVQETIGRIKVYRVGRGFIGKYFFPWLAYRKALELQSSNSYGVIWAMMANQAGWAALKFKRKFPAVKYLLTLQEGDSAWDIWLRTFLIRPLYKNIYRRADRIQVISNFLAERAKNLGAKCPISVVPNGIGWKTESGYRDGGRTIITTSRLEKKNGIEYLIRAMKDVDGRLLIVGEGKLRKKLEHLTAKLNLKDKVNFVGQVGHNQIHGYLRQANVFVRPSLSEGLGNSFLEAMADALPVVATPVGGIPDFLIDGQTGWFCQVKDPASIAEKINYILEPKNQAVVRRAVDQARQLVTEKYAWPRLAEVMKNIFNQLLAL